MNKKLADYIQSTTTLKNFMNEIINFAKAENAHVAYAIGKVAEKKSADTLVNLLAEIDEENYIISDQSKTAEQKEIAVPVIVTTLLRWFPAIGQDMKQFVN